MKTAFAHCLITMAVSAVPVGLALAVACSSSNSAPPPGQTGSTCTTAAQCYPGVDAGALQGTVTCLTQLQNGYCTHTCQTNANCCTVPSECPTGLAEICSPLQSAGTTYCLVACDSASIAANPNAGTTDPGAYCQRWANPTFTCRSSGGGSANQKFCGP